MSRATTPPAPEPGERLSHRIGRLRARLGWTQSDLAERLAASRVAVSHFEAGLAVPSERTVVLLAGLFGLDPLELVEGTDYPAAKAGRLPLVACRYTEADLQVALLRSEAELLGAMGAAPPDGIALWRASWRARLGDLLARLDDPRERAKVEQGMRLLDLQPAHSPA